MQNSAFSKSKATAPMHEAVVMGASAGGMRALKTILDALPRDFSLPVAIVQHVASHADSFMAEYLGRDAALVVKEAGDKEAMQAGHVYLAPPDYHLLLEEDKTFSLSVDARVNFSCPSIDVLFESAAESFGGAVIGVLLTGASADGSAGLKAIKKAGGLTIVQDPETAESPYMPQSALHALTPDHVLPLDQIAALLQRIAAKG